MSARRLLRPLRRSSVAVALLAALAMSGPGGVLAASVEELVKLAEGAYSMSCAANGTGTAQVCVHRISPWRAVIQPASGPEDQLMTESQDNTPPLDGPAAAWMVDMHVTACGDAKGVNAFVAAVAQMTPSSRLREIKDTIGACDFVGGLSGGSLTPLTYRVTSSVKPAPTATPTIRPSGTPGQTSGSTPAPSSSGSGQATPGASASAGASATAGAGVSPGSTPSAGPSGLLPPAASGSPAPSASTGPSPIVGGQQTGPPGPDPSGVGAGPGLATPAPTPGARQPTFDQSVLGVGEVNTDGGAIAGSLLLTLLMLMIVGFAGELFNNTVENNYSEISSWFRKRPLGWLRAAGGRLFGQARMGLIAFLVLTALISSFVDPNFGLDVRSLAELLGMFVGLVVVLASFKLPPMLAHRRTTGELGTLRPLPWALVIAIVFVLVSRIANLQPGYLYGIVLGVLFVKEVSPRDEGRETFYGALWTLGAAVLGWVGLTWLRGLGLDADAFATTLLATACAAVMVAGLEATAFGLMPLRFMPGFAVYRWNRLGWALLWGLSLFGFLHILIAPTSGYVSQLSPEAFAAALGVFAAFGALSIAVWGYFRFRGPVAAPVEVRFD